MTSTLRQTYERTGDDAPQYGDVEAAIVTVRHQRRRRAMGAATIIAVAALSVGVVVHGQLAAPDLTPTRQVPLPSVEAGPRQVVRVYLAAFQARDFDTALALVQPGARESFTSLFSHPYQISDVRVGQAFGRPSQPGAYLGETDVAVTFQLHGGDVSMPDGHTVWGYQLRRVGPLHRWMIYGEGTG